jgi:hypothetical protein
VPYGRHGYRQAFDGLLRVSSTGQQEEGRRLRKNKKGVTITRNALFATAEFW